MVDFQNIEEKLSEFISSISYSQFYVLADENTAKHCIPLLQSILPENYFLLTIEAGEENKTIETCEQLWNQMLQNRADRQAFLLNVGGGVVTDLGGFVAGCYKRGINFANIPTSLLAMVDASVGGKTGIDFGSVKNSIGLFYQPERVFVDSIFLNTLPEKQFNNGKAEIIKHGLIASFHHYNNFLELNEEEDYSKLIQESVAIKHKIVYEDPKESGLRKILNFGHTLGHAIEAYSLEHDDDYLLHGEAIAMGMVAEAWLSTKFSGLNEYQYQDIKKTILENFTIRKYEDEQLRSMLAYLKNDKKNQDSNIRMSLLESIGKATYDIEIPDEKSFEALKLMCNE